jgi:hypothetical protein
MSSDLKKAEQTSVNAARAMVRLLDFATDVLREISKTVSVSNSYRMVRTDPVRFSTNDHFVLKRYTSGDGPGDMWPKRYLFAPFVMPHAQIQEAGGGRLYPFIHVSLINSEDRAPSILYGFLRDADGRERHQEVFLENYLMWLNEGLSGIKKKAKSSKNGFVIDQKLPARAETQMLTARVVFDEMPLLDITGTNLPERANKVVDWFRTAVPASTPK